MASHRIIHYMAVCLIAAPVSFGHPIAAQDFADPADFLTYKHQQKANHAALPELDATVVSASSAKPGWYALQVKLDEGTTVQVAIVPATKFYKDYAPLAASDAYPLLIPGCKVRALHDPEQDVLLRNIIVTDLMFSSPPVEFAGTIKTVVSTHPGTYDLTIDLSQGAEHHLSTNETTKFWKGDQPLTGTLAYPQLKAGQKVRALEVAAPGGLRHVSDLMLVGL